MEIRSKSELLQKLIEMFNDTKFELLRDGFEIKQPMSLEDWTDIHAPDEQRQQTCWLKSPLSVRALAAELEGETPGKLRARPSVV